MIGKRVSPVLYVIACKNGKVCDMPHFANSTWGLELESRQRQLRKGRTSAVFSQLI